MAKITFNASKKEAMEERNFENIPDGEYIALINKSEMKRNKNDTANRLNIQFVIEEGEFKGRILFVGLNMDHPNQTAQEISDRELKSIMLAIGKGNDTIEDTEELHGVSMKIKIGMGKPGGEYTENGETKFKFPARNEIKAYSTLEESPTEGTSKTLPWEKKESTEPEKPIEEDIPF